MTSSAFETVTPDPIAYLDRVAATGLGRAYKRRMLDELEIRPGQTVLDLGCGPGTDLAALAEAATATGTVIGFDHDRTAVDTAGHRTAGHSHVSVRLGDLHDLPLPDHTADRARTDRVLQHVADPVQALREARRVLRPGGRLVMGEPDWGTLTVDHPDSDLSRVYTQYVTDKAVRNARIGSRLRPGTHHTTGRRCRILHRGRRSTPAGPPRRRPLPRCRDALHCRGRVQRSEIAVWIARMGNGNRTVLRELS